MITYEALQPDRSTYIGDLNLDLLGLLLLDDIAKVKATDECC